MTTHIIHDPAFPVIGDSARRCPQPSAFDLRRLAEPIARKACVQEPPGLAPIISPVTSGAGNDLLLACSCSPQPVSRSGQPLLLEVDEHGGTEAELVHGWPISPVRASANEDNSQSGVADLPARSMPTCCLVDLWGSIEVVRASNRIRI